MTERQVQNALFKWFPRSLLVVPNIGTDLGEADIIRYLHSRSVEEYEIKISRADFVKDKSKRSKHIYLQDRHRRCPNRFFYVCPKEIKAEVPEYAGLIEFTLAEGQFFFNVVKAAPLLHKHRCDVRRMAYLIRGITIRYWLGRA